MLLFVTGQASSQSSFKLSPLPKLNQEADESRRNSPANQQSVLNIKQELLDMGSHASLPQELIPVSMLRISEKKTHIVTYIHQLVSFSRQHKFLNFVCTL